MTGETGSSHQRLHARVEGRVQGVGFRYFVLMKAQALELTGWVGNRVDGQVEVLAEGEHEPLEKLLAALYEGPRGAFVMDVHYEWGVASGEFDHFGVQSR
jgi:acylphosphatase